MTGRSLQRSSLFVSLADDGKPSPFVAVTTADYRLLQNKNGV